MDKRESPVSHTWVVRGELDGEPTVYKIESQQAIGKWEAIFKVIDHLNDTLEGLHTFNNPDASPAKAPLVDYL